MLTPSQIEKINFLLENKKQSFEYQTPRANFKGRAAQLELKQAMLYLQELLKNPETFKEEFKLYCKRNEYLESQKSHNSISFSDVIWKSTIIAFEPKNLKDILSILLPKVTRVVSLSLHEKVPHHQSYEVYMENPSFELEEQLLHRHPVIMKESLPINLSPAVVDGDMIFFLSDILHLSFEHHQKIYAFLHERYLSLALKIYSCNPELQALDYDIQICLNNNKTPAERIFLFINRFTSAMEKGKDSEAVQEVRRHFGIFWNNLPSGFKLELHLLTARNGKKCSEIIEELETGKDIENVVNDLKSFFSRHADLKIMHTPLNITKERLNTISNKYRSQIKNPSKIDVHAQVELVPEHLLMFSLKYISIDSVKHLMDLLQNFPIKFYDDLFKTISIQNQSLVLRGIAQVINNEILTPEQTFALSNAINKHIDRFGDLKDRLEFSVATNQLNLFNRFLALCPNKEAQLLLEQKIDIDGNTLLHNMADKPDFLDVAFKLFRSIEERGRILALKDGRSGNLADRALSNLISLKKLLAVCPNDDFKLSLFKTTLGKALQYPQAFQLLLESLSNDNLRVKALQTLMTSYGGSLPGDLLWSVINSFIERKKINGVLNTRDYLGDLILNKMSLSFEQYRSILPSVIECIEPNSLLPIILNPDKQDISVFSIALEKPELMRILLNALPDVLFRITALFKSLIYNHSEYRDTSYIIKAFHHPDTLVVIFEILSRDIEWIKNNLHLNPEIWLSVAEYLTHNVRDMRILHSPLALLLHESKVLSAYCLLSNAIKTWGHLDKSVKPLQKNIFIELQKLQNIVLNSHNLKEDLHVWADKNVKNVNSCHSARGFFDTESVMVSKLFTQVYQSLYGESPTEVHTINSF